ncbi:MAG: multiheme c-type cytochrome [Candidatus Methylomirabilota bacterium]
MSNTRHRTYILLGVSLVALVLAGCATQMGADGKMVLKLPSEVVSDPWAAKGYVGPQACATCHEQIYNYYRDHGHPKKLRPAAEAREWGTPLPEGYTWDEISYVIGGATRKSRYIDQKGFIITKTGPNKDKPGNNQYNIATGRWVDYEAGKEKKYECGPCHMSAYSKEGNQDGRPGMVGTWAFPGITCEECHGPGKAHVAGPTKANIKVDRSEAACGKCHIRGAKERIPAAGGFIQHHEQYNELLASPHAGKVACVTCHDPHKRAAVSVKVGCDGCHAKQAADFKGSRMEKSGVKCTDCHMPAATKSAESFGKYIGDIKTHIVKIDTRATASMFTADGKFATGITTVDFACLRCHGSRDKTWASANAPGIHTRGK